MFADVLGYRRCRWTENEETEKAMDGDFAEKLETALQIILDLCIPKKELAKTCSPISFI